jgi:hypothetical protein
MLAFYPVSTMYQQKMIIEFAVQAGEVVRFIFVSYSPERERFLLLVHAIFSRKSAACPLGNGRVHSNGWWNGITAVLDEPFVFTGSHYCRGSSALEGIIGACSFLRTYVRF